MAARTFTAPDGTVWQVWNVVPGQHSESRRNAPRHLPPSLANGWLCFESLAEKRRLHPVPPGWEEQSDDGLWHWCTTAEPVPRRTPRPT